MALPTILRDLTLEDLSALLSQIAALRPEPWQALLSFQVHTVRWPTEPATIPLVVLSSHEGQGPRKRICPKKLKAGWGERNGKSLQRPTSPGEDGHRDRALARKARGVQMAGQTQESEGIYTRQVLPAHLRVPVEFTPSPHPSPHPRSCLSPLIWAGTPVPVLFPSYVHSIQRIPVKSSVPSYHCSAQCPRVVPVFSHTCRLSLMHLPAPHSASFSSETLPRLGWNSQPTSLTPTEENL